MLDKIENSKQVIEPIEHYFNVFVELTDQKIATQKAILSSKHNELNALKEKHKHALGFLLPVGLGKKIVVGIEKALGITFGKNIYKQLNCLEQYQQDQARLYQKIAESTAELKAVHEFKAKTLESTFSLSRWLNTEHRNKGAFTYERARNVFKELSA